VRGQVITILVSNGSGYVAHRDFIPDHGDHWSRRTTHMA